MVIGDWRIALKRYGFDSSDPIDVWLNAAYQDFQSDHAWPWARLITTVATTPGVSTLSLPSNFSRVFTVRDTAKKDKLTYFDLWRFEREISDMDEVGNPIIYTVHAPNVISVWPVPASAVNLRVVYEKSFAELSDVNPTPDMPVRFHYIPIFRAAAIALMAENEEDRSQTAIAEYNAAVEKANSLYAHTELGDEEAVEDVQGYF